MGFSFLHIADIHLGRQFSGLSKYSCDEKVKSLYKKGVEQAFNNFINFAIDKNVEFVLIAGDTFDSSEQDFESKLVLKSGLIKLQNAGIKAFLICGNHDPLISYNKATFNFDENSDIKIVGLNSPVKTTFKLDDYAQVHAISFENNEFRQNPAELLPQLSIEDKKLFNIGLIHCDLNADKSSVYAPCSVSDLKALNYNYWALGHIHLPNSFDENIFYSGTLQGRNTKETGSHGFRYVQVENSKIISNEFINCDVIRYEDIEVDLSEIFDITSAYNKIVEEIENKIEVNDIELSLVRITLTGNVKYIDEINDMFYSSVSERIKEEFNQKIYVSNFYNKLIAKVDEQLLKEDDGIVGEIYNVLQQDDNIDFSFAKVQKQLKSIISDCDFDEYEFENLKAEIISESKEKCLNICNIVYNNENSEAIDE